MNKYTYEQISADFALWGEYFDTSAEMSESEFDALTIEAKIAMLVDAFGTN